ncbi:hypothetical protein AJ88_42525 [Mesorhizobium amorphae CCBAU 01583]|nr:hypothetical protein AJ88_42525 [Mesorhizobium amorphae CCBAU 01583]
MNLSLFAGSAFHRKYANELKTHGWNSPRSATVSPAPFRTDAGSASATTWKRRHPGWQVFPPPTPPHGAGWSPVSCPRPSICSACWARR